MTASLILALLLPLIPFQNSCRELNNDVFRLHILANSDSAADQSAKLQVRDSILEEISSLYDQARSKEDAEDITRAHLTLIRNTAVCALRRSGIDDPVHVEMARMYFNTRYYDDFTMPAGYYDALRVTIGKGGGRNWWCVMYPCLCVGAAADDSARDTLSSDEYEVISSDDIEYRFKIVEVYEKIRSFFV